MAELFRVTAEITIPARDKYEAIQRLETMLAAVPGIQSFTVPPSIARVVPQAERMPAVSRRGSVYDCEKGHRHLTTTGAAQCNGTGVNRL